MDQRTRLGGRLIDGEALAEDPKSPFFEALNADRYDRQGIIRQYEELTGRSLIVYIGEIASDIVPPFNDAVLEATDKLDLMLASLGGDAEAALRMAKACHANRADFRVIVPDQAKSAATMLALAAEVIVMSDTSDLGPVDPQILMSARRGYYPAKGVVEAVADLEEKISKNPDAYPLYAAMLGDIDALTYQHAKDAVKRTQELVDDFLECRTAPPSSDEATRLVASLTGPAAHSAVVGHESAAEMGLPVVYMDPRSEEWDVLWRLYVKYHLLAQRPGTRVIEARRVSLVSRQRQRRE